MMFGGAVGKRSEAFLPRIHLQESVLVFILLETFALV